jgi:cytochrome c-type biogenesis protein
MDKAKKNFFILLLIIIVIAAGLFILAQNLDPGSGGSAGAKPWQKTPAPDFSLQDEDGDTHTLSDYRGKYVVINIWGSWCSYCVYEMPDFQKANETFNEAGDTVILSVNDTSTEVSVKTALSFIHENGYDMIFLFDMDGTVADLYDISGYPTTFIIDKEGYIYKVRIGSITESGLYDIIEALRKEDE